MIARGEICDAKTIITLQYLALLKDGNNVKNKMASRSVGTFPTGSSHRPTYSQLSRNAVIELRLVVCDI